MIDCLLIRISQNQDGHAVREEHLLSGEELSIGRGEGSAIHLADPRANLHFASIKRAGDGTLVMDGEGTLLNVGGVYEHAVPLAQEMRILLGPYEFVVEKLGGEHDLDMSMELIHPLPAGDDAEKTPPRSLAETGLSKRKLSYWLAGIILAVFLAAPLVAALNPSVRASLAHASLSPSRLWNPGAVSPGHSSFGHQCVKCHEAPFRPVRNAACISCHKATGDHLENHGVNQQAFGKMSCTECHQDHQNSRPIAMQGGGECILCHGDIKARHTDSTLPDIHDFGIDHPDFRLAFKTGINAADVRRVAQADISKVVENSGLEFPHDQHVGLVAIPWDMMSVKDMRCADCHEADAGGLHFKPISMQKHCYACHREQFEFHLAPTGRHLPHGSETALSSTLRDFYAGLAFKEKKSAEWVDAQMEKAVSALSEGSGCDYCHTVQPGKADGNVLAVSPIRLTGDWFPAARFPHARHSTISCVECHKVEQSTQSSDVAIPAIQSCKQCHTGSQPAGGKVASNCISCHAFHAARIKSP